MPCGSQELREAQVTARVVRLSDPLCEQLGRFRRLVISYRIAAPRHRHDDVVVYHHNAKIGDFADQTASFLDCSSMNLASHFNRKCSNPHRGQGHCETTSLSGRVAKLSASISLPVEIS